MSKSRLTETHKSRIWMVHFPDGRLMGHIWADIPGALYRAETAQSQRLDDVICQSVEAAQGALEAHYEAQSVPKPPASPRQSTYEAVFNDTTA